MVDDFKQVLKVYRMYKKGKSNMEKTIKFIETHTKEILMGIGFIAAYQIGYKRGFRNGIKFEDALMRLASRGGK